MKGHFAANSLTDSDFMRFSRQILLPEVGEAGQAYLAQCHVAIIGVGGLGQLVAQYLVCAGVGAISLIDGDRVELSNLPRQLLFNHADIGKNKAGVAKDKLTDAAPRCEIFAYHTHFSPANAHVLLAPLLSVLTNSAQDTPTLSVKANNQSDRQRFLVLDCTDNFESRQSINLMCHRFGLRLVSAAISAFSGQLFAVDQICTPKGGCYHCIFPADTQVTQTCTTAGVLGPSVGVMGSMQALVALNLLLNIGEMTGQFWRFDAKALSWTVAKLSRDVCCTVCGKTTTLGNNPIN